MRWITGSVIAQLAVGSLILFVAGCSRGPEVPSDPIPTPPVVPTTYTISGVVTEAGRPIAGASVGAWVERERAGGPFGGVQTDEQGHYRLAGLVSGARVRLLVSKNGYVQQCAAAPLVIQGDSAIDLGLVSRANLTASIAHAPSGFRTVSGTIVEVTSSGKQPVAGAYVAFHEATEDVSVAETYSDAAGRFALCDLPGTEAVSIGAYLGGSTATLRAVYILVPPAQSDIEIVLP
jgi:hypothetical protein